MKKKYPSIREIREAHAWKREYERFLPVSRFLFRPAGFWVTWFAVRIGLTTEAVSWLSGFIGLSGCLFLVIGHANLLPFGVALLLIFNLLDCVDGSIARTMKTENPYGRFLDSLCGGFIDIIFWTVIGVAAYQHPSLLIWDNPLGLGSSFWLTIGVVSSFGYIMVNYTERTFDGILREIWDVIVKNKSVNNTSHNTDMRYEQNANVWSNKEIILRILNNNLRVRETHYMFLVLAFFLRSVDFLLFFYCIYYIFNNIILWILYCRRGLIVKKNHSRSGELYI